MHRLSAYMRLTLLYFCLLNFALINKYRMIMKKRVRSRTKEWNNTLFHHAADFFAFGWMQPAVAVRPVSGAHVM